MRPPPSTPHDHPQPTLASGRDPADQSTSPVQSRLAALAGQALHVVGPGDPAANWVATRQHGIITRAQVMICGLGRSAVAGRCRRGSWKRLHPGVYLVGTQPPTEYARVLAAVLSSGPHAVAGSLTAAWLWGFGERPPAVVHVAVLGRRTGSKHEGVRLHRPTGVGWTDVRWRNGIPLTSPLETLFAVAPDLGPDELEAACALAARHGLVSARTLADAVEGAPPRPGLPELRRITRAERTPALTRSSGERLMLAVVRKAELPEPETNVVVLGKEVDLYWPEARLAVEVDAFSTHGAPSRFEDDRLVEANLEAAGIQLVRFTRRRIRSAPHAVAARLAALLTLRLGGLPPPRRR